MGRKVIYAFLNCLHCDREGIVKHKFDNSHVPGVRNLPQAVWKFTKLVGTSAVLLNDYSVVNHRRP